MNSFIIWGPSPIIADFGPYGFRWYSLFFGLGFVLSYIILQSQFREKGLSVKLLDKLTIYVVIATVVGARLAHCIFYDWEYYSDHPLEIFLPVKFEPSFQFTGFLGLASHGGIFGIIIAVFLFARNYKVNAMWIFDKLAIVGALAGACIRLGNLMNSEILGTRTDVAWAFVFTRVDQVPRHPAQLYEALSYLLIFGFLYTLDKTNKRQPGFLFGLFFILLFTARFLIEFVKANQAAFETGMALNMGQWLSIPFILFGISVAVLMRGKEETEVL